jgi:hypothetical protein
MNRDQYQKKLQVYHTNVEPRLAQTPTTGLLIYPSDESLHELQVLQIEQKKKVGNDKQPIS